MKSVKNAFSGLLHALQTERHMKFHVAMACLVLILGAIVSLTAIEWIIILIVIASVISLELVNTAIERAVDFTGTHQHPLARNAKDMAAAAVLIVAVTSVIVGFIIFAPKVINLLFN